ncbi:MAG: hypothetical protein EOP81_11515 [Variovorax sp.]|nr:MAG: hypothetical protein EOP81_11515 [Variovorax sp.]
MNPQWNTPPNGDFARYVERLTAQTALPSRATPQGERLLDEGMASSSETSSSNAKAVAAAQRHASPGGASDNEGGERKGIPHLTKLMVALGGLLVLAALSGAGVPGVVVALLVGGLWVGRKLLRGLVAPGPAKWQRVLEEAARRQGAQRKSGA